MSDKTPDCIYHNQPDEFTASVRRAVLLRWTTYAEELVRAIGPKQAASRRIEKHVQADLDKLKRDFDAGDKGAVISAIEVCFRNESPVPGWAQNEFINVCGDIHFGRSKSWDEVFGRPHKKGAQLGAMRRKKRLGLPVLVRVRERHAGGEPIGKDLFDSVGEELGIGGTLVSEIYSEAKKGFDEFMKEEAER
jgi:hypothetical protein